MAREDIEQQANKISVWWGNSKFDSERADRLLREFNSGPDKFIDPELTASENWTEIKNEYDLRGKDKKSQNREKYRQKAKKREIEIMHSDQIVAVEKLEIPAGAAVEDISQCFGHNPIQPDHYETVNLTIPTRVEQGLNRIRRVASLDNNNTTPQETQRGLLRFGGPEVVRIIYDEILQDHMGTLPQYREVTKCNAEYIPGKSQGYLGLDSQTSLDFPGESTDRQSFRIHPWQKEIFEWVSDQISISQNDAYRWALAVATGEWAHSSDDFPNPTKEDLDEVVGACHSQLREEAEAVRLSFILTVTEAFEEGNGEKVLEDCFSDNAMLLLDYLHTTQAISKHVKEFAENNMSDIEDELDKHPIEVSGLIHDVPEDIQ